MKVNVPYGVVDSDGHINEPEQDLIKYMEGPYGEIKKRIHRYYPDKKGTIGGGITAIHTWFDVTLGGKLGANGPEGFPTQKDWLKIAKEGNMETMVLFPTTLLAYSVITDDDYLVALTRAYNNYVHDNWLKNNPAFKSVALLPFPNVDESIKEMRRAVTELGFNGVFVAAVGFGLLGDKKYHKFYAEAEKLNCPIAVHGGHATAESVRYTKFIQRHTIGFPVSNMMQMMHMTYEGVFEKYPNLKVGYLEAGCTWVPYLLNRMDEEWEKRGWFETPNCKKDPSEYINGGNVFVHAEAAEHLIPEVIREMGQNRLMYASDWPHWDHEYPESILDIYDRKDLTSKDKKSILRDNALEFYGIKNGGNGSKAKAGKAGAKSKK
jgi:predicted TIM-barrel fold metal-dependent hydrolase